MPKARMCSRNSWESYPLSASTCSPRKRDSSAWVMSCRCPPVRMNRCPRPRYVDLGAEPAPAAAQPGSLSPVFGGAPAAHAPEPWSMIRLRVAGEMLKHLFPDAFVSPTGESFIDTVPIPVFGRKQPPLGAGNRIAGNLLPERHTGRRSHAGNRESCPSSTGNLTFGKLVSSKHCPHGEKGWPAVATSALPARCPRNRNAAAASVASGSCGITGFILWSRSPGCQP